MAKANCLLLRNLFIFFNLLFAIAGVVVFVLAVLVHFHLNANEFDRGNGVIGLYMVGSVTFLISFLGAYGALKNVKWMLVVFLVLMCLSCFTLLRFAMPLAILHPQVGLLQEEMENVGPLDKTSGDFQRIMGEFQSELFCCGLVNGYRDWNNNVPESCDCTTDEIMQDTCLPLPDNTLQEYYADIQLEVRSTRMVHKQPCGVIIVSKALDVILGVLFGFTTLAFLGIVMTCCLLAQRIKLGAVAKPSMIFSISSKPPKYSQLLEYK
ncbi:tetraspanin-8-like [Clupea harengus]|uniref:Tetraspanin-8-like n=1 Tax=Clupea harengus TaxID=7950 RepID=A0A6P3WF44_CLUHA|nr:tetraspanin-8-like [Clupea harengus]